MTSTLGRRVAAVAGGTAITAMVILTASCAKEEEKAPETSTTTTTTTTTTAGQPDREGPPPRARRTQPVLALGPRAAGADRRPRRQLSRFQQVSTRLNSGRRQCTDSAAAANDATWSIAMFSAACMSRGSRPVCDSR